MENLYEPLGISSFSNLSEIKRAFRQLAKQHHPDFGGERKRYDCIREAYEILMDPIKRKDHDQRLREAMAQTENTRCSGLDIGTKIEIILAWSTTNPRFDPSIINSFANQLSEGKQLSARQMNAIENVIRGFGILLEDWLDDDKRMRAIEKYFESQQVLKTAKGQTHKRSA